VTSFFGIKECVFYVFLENDKTDLRNFFQGLRENTCLLQPVLKTKNRVGRLRILYVIVQFALRFKAYFFKATLFALRIDKAICVFE